MLRLVVINGPTASGKTAFSISLAQALNTEILSCDSRQFYRELPIGSAQPSAHELSIVPHHFISSHSVTEELSAGSFERLALSKLDELFTTYDTLIMVGGSGMYEQAVCKGLDDLPHSPAERAKLMVELKENGISSLQEELLKRDPLFYDQIDLNNPQRLVRALEVCRISEKPYSVHRAQEQKVRPFEIVKFGMEMDRAQLYDRINKRVGIMMENGLLEEAKAVHHLKHLNSLKTVGYREMFQYFEGDSSLEEAIAAIQQNTRRFAKRQMTWYRRDSSITWLTSDEVARAIKQLS